MERTDVRRLLWRWGSATRTCAKMQKELQEYQDLMKSVTDIKGQNLDGMPHVGGVSDRTAMQAEKLERLTEMYEERINDIVNLIDKELRFRDVMSELIRTMGVNEQNVVDMHYRQRISYERIATMTDYEVRQIKRFESKAVDMISEHVEITKGDFE